MLGQLDDIMLSRSDLFAPESLQEDLANDEQKARRERQQYYNARERRRRHQLRNAFSSLQEPLQNLKERTPSRCKILRKAVQYIRALEQREAELSESIQALAAENKEIMRSLDDCKEGEDDDDDTSEDSLIGLELSDESKLYKSISLEKTMQGINHKERMDIVAKYDRGAIADPLGKQNNLLPALEAERIDRYGFLIAPDAPQTLLKDTRWAQATPPPPKSRLGMYRAKDPPSDEDAAREKARKRENKWSIMLSNWSVASKTEKFLLRIYKGIPDSLRSKVWRKMLNLETVKAKYNISGVNFYGVTRERARRDSADIRQIDLDVNRTFRENVYFRDRYNYRQQMLFHVLATYSIFNKNVGYCQGMNNIAALLVMYFEAEEDAFWGLTQLMSDPKYAMEGFFLRNFPKFAEFESVFNNILQKLLPKVKQTLDSLSVSSTMYLFKWLINCFIDALPFSLTLRVWDIFLCQGDRILLAMAYNIMKIYEREILRMRTIDSFLQFVSTQLSRSFSGIKEDIVIHKLQRALAKLRRHGLLAGVASGRTASAVSSLASVFTVDSTSAIKSPPASSPRARYSDRNIETDDDSSTDIFLDSNYEGDTTSRNTSIGGEFDIFSRTVDDPTQATTSTTRFPESQTIMSIVTTSFDDRSQKVIIPRSPSIYDNVSRNSRDERAVDQHHHHHHPSPKIRLKPVYIHQATLRTKRLFEEIGTDRSGDRSDFTTDSSNMLLLPQPSLNSRRRSKTSESRPPIDYQTQINGLVKTDPARDAIRHINRRVSSTRQPAHHDLPDNSDHKKRHQQQQNRNSVQFHQF